MKITKQQFKLMVENYLREQDDDIDAILDDESIEGEESQGEQESNDKPDVEEEKPEIPDTSFKVRYDDKTDDIELKSLKDQDSSQKSIFVNGDHRPDIDPDMSLQIIAAHGYIQKDISSAAKEVLRKILSRDNDFKGKSESGIKAVIADKMQSRLGAQSLGVEQIRSILLAKG